MAYRTGLVEETPLDARIIAGIANDADVQIDNFLITTGIFDATLICRARTNQAMGRFLDALSGWHTEAMIATRDIRFETVSSASKG
jgi:hypothetical protein